MVKATGIRNRLRSLPGRSALLSAGLIAVGMTIGAVLLLILFRGQLQANLDQTLEQQAMDRARLISQGTDPTSLANIQRGESMVWIGTLDGEAVSVTGAIFPLENPVPDTLDQNVTYSLLVEEYRSESDDIEIERMELRVSSAVTDDGSLVVLAASETDQISKTVRDLAWLFVAALPVLALLAGVLAWMNTKRALTPVERIRRQTTAVTGSNLSGRVSVPEGEDEIHDLAVTMNDMLERLESHQQSMKEFTSNASHELKSPVANLRTLIETAQLHDESGQSLKATLIRETERLRDLVENLLFLATHSDGTAPPSLERVVNVDDILFDEAELLAATKRVKVNIDGIGPAAVRGNSHDLQRLVRNLADNAARHANSTVTFTSSQNAHEVVIQVIDDGQGIPSDKRADVFERFTRLDSARARDDGGSGLGLAIVKRIAEDHEASVAISAAAGGGAVFSVTLPASQ